MTEVARPPWLTELIGVARQLHAASGGDPTAGGAEGPRRLGTASPDPESGPGWYWVDLRGQVVDSDQIEAAFLAPAEGLEQRRFQVIESAQDGGVLRVRVAPFAPPAGMSVWVPARGRARLEQFLLAGLSQISRFHLIDRFGQGRADPVPADPVPADQVPAVPARTAAASGRLNADQSRGLAACLAPGLHLVWGPPGTGTTTVLTAALRELIARGKTVLLVSGSDVAVDSVLDRAARDLDPAPGVIARVGTPHAASVAADPRICVQLMALSAAPQIDSARAEVAERIAGLRSHPDVARLDRAREELAGFDAAAYRAARQHIDNHDWLAGRRALMQQVRERAAASAAALAAARARHDRARRAWEESATARQHLNAATALEMELGNVALERDRAIADVKRLQADRDRMSGESAARLAKAGGLGRRRERKLLADLRADLDDQLGAAEARRLEAERILASFSGQLTAQIEDHIHAAYPITDDEVAQRRIAFGAADKQVRQAWEARQDCARQARELDGQITEGEREPQPSAADLELVAQADEHDLPRKLFGLPELERQASQVMAEIERLEERDAGLVSRLAEEGRTIRGEIIGRAAVVATTLATLAVTPEASQRDYDHVLIDEAAAAGLPDIVYAVSRATEGATLLGDFRQNAPLVPAGFARSRDPAIRRWLRQDCFALFGIHDRASAQASPGCVSLTQQYRLGPAVNDLVNAVAYEGLLHIAEGAAGPARPEMVLVDPGGLGPELAAPLPDASGPGTWSPAGALIGAALAAEHVRSSAQPVAIMAPRRSQAELIRSQLSDPGGPPKTEVGTADQFQGREFGTVVLDLAEDGETWAAQDRPGRGQYRLDGPRLFTVGVTRAARRLYLIGSEALVRGSDSGPLRALGQLLEQGRLRVVRVAEVVDLKEEPAGDPVARDIWYALRGHATLIGLSDESWPPAELGQRIDQAAARIWLGGRWAGQRPDECAPHLAAAADRGVRVHLLALSPGPAGQHLHQHLDELSLRLHSVVLLRREDSGSWSFQDRDFTPGDGAMAGGGEAAG